MVQLNCNKQGRPCTGQIPRQGLRMGTLLLAFGIVLLALMIIPGPTAAAPDLQVTFLVANRGGATAGSIFIKSVNPVTATVRNNGPDASPAVSLQLISSDGFSGTAPVPALASGALTFVTINDTTLRQTSDTTVNYTAIVDPGDLITEGNEANNVYLRSNLPVRFNGYRGKALYEDQGGNITTKYTYDIRGGIVFSFGDSYYRSGSFSSGWTRYNVTWNGTSPLVPAGATIRTARLYLPYTWDDQDPVNGTTYDMPDNVTVRFNGNTITRQDWYWDRGNFGGYGAFTYGLLSYDVTPLYRKNATNSMNFTRPGMADKLSLYGMTLAIIYDDPSASRKQIFLNEEFDLLGADYANYKTTEAESTAYVPFTGMTINPDLVKTANLSTFVPSGDSGEGNLLYNGAVIATDVWDYGTADQTTGEDGSPQVAVDVRDVKSYLQSTGNIFGIQSTARNSQPCMAASQQYLVVEYYDAPVAAFTGSVRSGTAPLTVTFTDTSANTPTSWNWTFGDGSAVNSTQKNPVHTFTKAGTYTVSLNATNAAGSDIFTRTGYITVTASPRVTAVSPASGPTAGGTLVTLTGTGFTGATAVRFGTTAGTGLTVNSDTNITIIAPAHTAGTVYITVTAPGGTSTTTQSSRFSYAVRPGITAVSPASGPTAGGTLVTLTGTGFTGATAVRFGTMAGTGITVNSASNITMTAPAHAAGTVYVTVTTPGGTSITTSGTRFAYAIAPGVTNVSPSRGPTTAGTRVTLTGTGFTGATAVRFGTTAGTGITVNSSTRITVTAPAHAAGTVYVTVTTPGGASATTSGSRFTYVARPNVTTVSPLRGPTTAGTRVTLTGTGFTGTTAVKFGTTAGTGMTVNSSTRITVTAPAHAAGTVYVTVTTPGGTSATGTANRFTYTARPNVTTISPASGPATGGSRVTLTGDGFTGATAVRFGTTAGTGMTVNSSSRITVTAPAHAAGTVYVTVTTPGGTSATGTASRFTYSAAP